MGRAYDGPVERRASAFLRRGDEGRFSVDMKRKIAVVLFNLGGPDNLESVRPFLFNLFNDPAIIPLPQPLRWLASTLISTLRANTAKEIYAHMGGGSPLLAETQAQGTALKDLLSEKLPDDGVEVFVAMRYWRPTIETTAAAVKAFAPDEVVLLPLYPQYSTTTTGSSMAAWDKAYKGGGRRHGVCCYPRRDDFIRAHADRIREEMNRAAEAGGLRLLFSAHGLPEKIIESGDPYAEQVNATATAVANAMGLKDWRVCYQSRVGPMKWIGPSTIEALEEAGRDKMGVIVVPIAFVSEHSETLVELDRDYREIAMRAGVPVYLRAAAIGVNPAYIRALADMTVDALSTPGVGPQSLSCQSRFSKCPFQQQAEAA